MMFQIEFTDERLIMIRPGEKGRVGLLVLGQHKERFVAHTQTWSEEQYAEHWLLALDRVLHGEPAALITDMATPVESSHLVWWPMWKIESEIIFHNQLLFFEQHRVQGVQLNVTSLYNLIGERLSQNSEGVALSEWAVPIADVKKFLRSAGDPPFS